jgi:transposase
MERTDGRSLSADALEERRKIIVRMKQAGSTLKEIAAATGCAISTIRVVWNKWKAGKNNRNVLVPQKRGRKQGEKRTLSPEQEQTIRHRIVDKRPNQLNLNCALWIRGAVQMLIEQEYGIVMPIRTVGEYLKRWGFTLQRPAYERDQEKVKTWLENTYPAIRKQAPEEHGDIDPGR